MQYHMNDSCPIFETSAHIFRNYADGFYLVDSPRAGGKFVISITDFEDKIWLSLKTNLNDLAAYIFSQNYRFSSIPKVDASLLRNMGQHRSVENIIDNVIVFISKSNSHFAEPIYLLSSDQFPSAKTLNHEKFQNYANWLRLLAATYSNTSSHIMHIIDSLVELNFIEKSPHNYSAIGLTFKGLERLDNSKINLNSKNAFVAMWFSSEMDEPYSNAIEPAIRKCGYNCIRVDQKEHLNKIDDEIIANIRSSRFLVADFTSKRNEPRGGVYFEAGFALGLGLPVIWTCRADLIDQVHFDTRQYNHIVWQNVDDLRKKLELRIAATIGSAGD